MNKAWRQLNDRVTACERCPRLRAHCRRTAETKRAAFADQTYWARPVPNLGEPGARVLLVGLAPAAHGANRTGRMFTGDRSGDFLFEAMHRAGMANQPTSVGPGDGLQLIDAAITAAAHCAPPANKPNRNELDHCAPWLEQTIALMPNLRAIVALGKIGHDETLRLYKRRGVVRALADHPFAHAAAHRLAPPAPLLLDTYHPSQQNTFTGRLTPDMLLDVFRRAMAADEE